MNANTPFSTKSATTSTATRRTFIQRIGTLATAALAANTLSAAQSGMYVAKNGRIQQSVVHWCFQPIPVEQLAAASARMGLKSVELVAPEHWPALKKHGLICAISGSHGFAKGFAHKEEHAECIDTLRKSIDATADAGYPSVITFSGFRRGLSDDQALENMFTGLKQIVPHAEKRNVTLCLEMLNTRVNAEMKGHPDYWCDKIELAVEVCKRIASERMKILFDIYHVQIMQGDVIARIREFHPYIGHYHTAGVPGRAEIDDTQEINYPPIMKAIAETGYRGYVGQEFIPTRDKVASLNDAVRICDI